MALYTSYYTRQLALRPESLPTTELNEDAQEKTVQKSVVRRTVDVTGPWVRWLEAPPPLPHARPLDGTPASALDLLPPAAYGHQPVSSFAVKFAAQAPSKTRSSVNAAVWTRDGRRCLTGTQAGEFCMWNGQSFQFETIIQAHETPIRSMVFTHAGNFLVSADDGGNVRYWRPNLELVKSFSAHAEAIRQVSFAPTDLKFATASDDSTVRVWDFARVTSELVLAGHGGDVKCADWHPTSSLVVSGSKDGLLKLWCPRSGKNVSTMYGHKGTITTAAWGSNGHWVLTASRDQTCRVYDVRMRSELATFTGQGSDITHCAWHSLHEDVFVSGSQDGGLCYWLVGRQGPQAVVPYAHQGSVWTLAWHPAGHLLVSGSSDATTKFWCRARPGDPFMAQQEAERAELASVMAATEERPVGEATPPPAMPAMQMPPAVLPGLHPKSGIQIPSIPGLGQAAPAPPAAAPPAGAPMVRTAPGISATEDFRAPRAPFGRAGAPRGRMGRGIMRGERGRARGRGRGRW